MEFQEFAKIGRLSRECVVTEKIDGTNASVVIEEASLISDWTGTAATPWLAKVEHTGTEYGIAAGSRTRYITPHADNHGWAKWVHEHASELVTLGPGRHYGEWWGSGIQRGYGLQKGEKRFSLFNVGRWDDARDREKFPVDRPACCGVVPTVYRGTFDSFMGHVDDILERLREFGSRASPGFMQPEGIVIFHTANGTLFKKTLERDEEPKTLRGGA